MKEEGGGRERREGRRAEGGGRDRKRRCEGRRRREGIGEGGERKV